jgi:putative transposase
MLERRLRTFAGSMESVPRRIATRSRRYGGMEVSGLGRMKDLEEHGIEVVYIQKGKPQQNGFAERFNGSSRYEFLDAYLFESLSQVREMAWLWLLDDNDARPHESLEHLPPSIYRQNLENSSSGVSH